MVLSRPILDLGGQKDLTIKANWRIYIRILYNSNGDVLDVIRENVLIVGEVREATILINWKASLAQKDGNYEKNF